MKKTQRILRFSKQTIAFLKKAGRQKHPLWLERNKEEYDEVLRGPLTHLALTAFKELKTLAPDYHFPKKGLGRMKRSSRYVEERGGGLFKNWMTYSASRPRTSRFEHNPNLFFLINSEDKKDPVLVAGGLYMPSSQQMRKIREFIANDASCFDQLFSTKEFSKHFPGGFSLEKTAKSPPRGFDPHHKRIDWLKLQAFFVWRPYSKKEFYSPKFAEIVTHDFKQILKLNRLLEKIISGQRIVSVPKKSNVPNKKNTASVLTKIEDLDGPRWKMDF